MTDQPRPCPFCGAEYILNEPDRLWWHSVINNANVAACPIAHRPLTEAVIAKWNTRAGDGWREMAERLAEVASVFLGRDERFQVSVGGNPNAIDEMLASSREALAAYDGKVAG